MASDRSTVRKKELRAFRRALVLPFAVAALLLLPLAVWKRLDSRIAADLQLRELAFDLDQPGTLLDSRPYARIDVSRRASGNLRSKTAMTRMDIPADGSLSIERPRLDALQIEPHAHVTIARYDPSNLMVSVGRARSVTSLSIPAGASLLCTWCTIDGTSRDRYQTILGGDATLTLQSNELRLVLANDGSAIAEGLSIRNPLFVSGTAEHPGTSLIGRGEIALRDVPGYKIDLIGGDDLTFGEPHDLTLTTIEPSKSGGLHVAMTGWVREVRSAGANRMPSLLTRLHASRAFALYATAVILLAGMTINAIRELRLVREPK